MEIKFISNEVLDEAIEHCKEIIDKHEDCDACVEDHRNLYYLLLELKQRRVNASHPAHK